MASGGNVDFELSLERTVTLKEDLRKGARIEGPRFPPALKMRLLG